MRPTTQEVRRIRQELKAAGATSFGLSKFASRFLPNVLHEGEHIKGAVYGRYSEGTGLLRWVEGILIATDRRVIFLDRKPGFEAMDELTYDVVSGVQKSYAWPFASITLHTRIGNYTLRFANKRCIDIFMQYVEKRRLETPNGSSRSQPMSENVSSHMDDRVMAFLKSHDIAVLSSVDRLGNPYAAAVHYVVIDNRVVYILTRAETQKAHNILAHPQVALTIYDRVTMQTLQLQAMAAPEANQAVRSKIFASLSGPRTYGDHVEYPPVTTLADGAYMVIRILPYSARLSEFSPNAALYSPDSSTGPVSMQP